jgi:hypothetical protein
VEKILYMVVVERQGNQFVRVASAWNPDDACGEVMSGLPRDCYAKKIKPYPHAPKTKPSDKA